MPLQEGCFIRLSGDPEIEHLHKWVKAKDQKSTIEEKEIQRENAFERILWVAEEQKHAGLQNLLGATSTKVQALVYVGEKKIDFSKEHA